MSELRGCDIASVSSAMVDIVKRSVEHIWPQILQKVNQNIRQDTGDDEVKLILEREEHMLYKACFMSLAEGMEKMAELIAGAPIEVSSEEAKIGAEAFRARIVEIIRGAKDLIVAETKKQADLP
jgi:hypothetical protein